MEIDDERLRRVWKVYDYEARMCRESWFYFQQLAATEAEGSTLRNALLESHILHVRILCEWLTSNGGADCLKLRDLLGEQNQSAVANEKAALRAAAFRDTDNPYHLLSMKLLHPGDGRGESYEYGPTLAKVHSPLEAMMQAVEARRPSVCVSP